MPVVKPYPLPSDAQTRPMPTNFGGAGGSAASFGPTQMPQVQQQWGEARDLQVAGAQLERASNNISEIALGIAKDVNESRVQELNNQFIAAQQDLLYNGDNAFYRQQGKNAIDAAPVATQRLQEIKKGLLDQTSNQYQKDRLTRILDGHVNEVTNGMSRFVAAQSMEWQKQVDTSKIALTVDQARNDWNDPGKVSALADANAATAISVAGRSGHAPDSDYAQMMAKHARSVTYATVINTALMNGNTAYAVTMYDKVKGQLDTETDQKLDNAIRTARVQDTALRQAVELGSPLPGSARAEEGTKASLQFWKGDGYSQRVSAGITAGFLRESQFYPGAVNKGDGRDGSDSINIGQWNGPRGAAFRQYAADNKLDPNDPMTGLKYAKAEIDGVIPYSVSGLSPELKDKLKNAKSEKEAADLMTRYYFRPKYTEGESSFRQGSASAILAKYGEPEDPVAAAVNQATGVAPPQNGPQYRDTRQMLLDADLAYEAGVRRNDEINANDDAQRRATKAQLDAQLAARKRDIEIQKLNLEIAVDKWMTASPDGRGATQRPPPEIWNQLSYEKQKSIDATIAHNLKGQDVQTDQRVWYEVVKGLSAEDPIERKKWAEFPLWEAKPKLSNQDFQELAKMQATVRKGDPDKEMTHVRSINQMVDDTLLKMKIDPTPKQGSSDAEKAGKFRRAVQEQITALERETGKKATVEQQQKIIDGMAIEVVTKPGMLWDSTKSRYEMTIKDVPDDEKAKITDALKRGGIPVNDQTIIDLFARKNAKAPK